MKKLSAILCVWMGLCVFNSSAFAAIPSLPAGESLEAQAERFEQENSVETKARQQVLNKALVEAEESQKAAAGPEVTFLLKDIRLTGATVFDPQYFAFIWKPYLNKKVSYNDLYDIVSLIKRVYKDLGFLTTTAYLPPQDIKDGVVEIRVVEGKRGKLTIQGNKWCSTPSIAKYFHTYEGEVLDMGEMQKDMMRMNKDKDLNVTSLLSPGQDPETIDVALKATENVPYHVSIGTDNQGSRLTGTYRRLVNINTTNLTGNEDTLAFNGAYTDLSSGYYLSYQAPVGTYGTRLGLDTGYFQGKLGDEFKQFDVVNYTEFYDPNASFELYSSQTSQINLRTGMQIQDIQKKQATTSVTDEELRMPYVAVDAMRMDSMGQTSFSPELIYNAPGFLGASRKDNTMASRPGTDTSFVKYDQFISRYQNMPWGSYMQIKSEFQTASHTLPTSAQMQLGGDGSVRGYPVGDYLADTGGYLDADWYFPMYLIPASWKMYGTSMRQDIEPVIFTDIGGGRLIQANTGEVRDQFLSGVGAGVRIRIKGNMYLKLEWAVATGDKPISGTGPSTFDVAFQAGT